MKSYYKIPKEEYKFKWDVLIPKITLSLGFIVVLIILMRFIPEISPVVFTIIVPIVSGLGSVIMTDVLGLKMQKEALEEHLVEQDDQELQ